MSFEIFDNSEYEKYKEEVKERFGGTKEYDEYSEKIKEKSEAEIDRSGKELMNIFAEIGKIKELPPQSREVQEKIASIQAFITENYYTCTDKVFASLGQMYVSDERMKKNIDKAGGEGTAEYVSKAISFYCKE